MTDSGALSYAEDFTNAVDVLLSENINSIYVVQVSNDQVAYDDTSAARIVSSQRITIADGYRAFVYQEDTPYDGYLNPALRQANGGSIGVLSNNQLASNMFLIGPICFPYTYNNFSGGLDPLAVFQPQIGTNNNLQVYIQINGIGLPETSNFFSIKKIMLTGKGIKEGTSYKILVENANINVPGTV